MKEQEVINLVEKTLMGSLPPKQKIAECLLQIEQWKATHPADTHPGEPAASYECEGYQNNDKPN